MATADTASSSAGFPSISTSLDEEWNVFDQKLRTIVPSMVGICSLFAARQLPCSLKSLRLGSTHPSQSNLCLYINASFHVIFLLQVLVSLKCLRLLQGVLLILLHSGESDRE